MSQKKKSVREAFRRSVFDRDGHRCKMCGWRPMSGDEGLDAHHITDRTLIANGGYVAANGISLCSECHLKAEEFHQTGVPAEGFSVEELYQKINSSHEKAVRASERLGG